MKIIGIVQARLGSSRLPGKVLLDIEGRPLIQHVVERCAASKHIEQIVVATTEEADDDRLARYLDEELKVPVFRGSTDDVLSRFIGAARQAGADMIVRITADDPLKDAAVIDEAIEALLADPSLDYCSNTLNPTFPEGLDIEVFRFAALERANREARLASEREHVTPYIWKNPDLFRVKNFEYLENISDWRLTVDKPDDLELMRAIFAALGKGSNLFSYRDVIALLKEKPELRDINAGTVRNEGYLKSLNEENS